MKRLLTYMSLLAALCFPVMSTVYASAAFDPFEEVCTGSIPKTGEDASTVCVDKDQGGNPLSGNDGIIIRAARILSYITGIASVIVIMIAGIKYVTSGGDSNSINSAKSTMVYALVGLIVTAVAQGIIMFVLNRLN